MNKFILFLAFFCMNSFGMEVKINCQKLEGHGTCFIQNGAAEFLSINKRWILFKEGPYCQAERCDFIGKGEPHYLKVGRNDIFFKVATVTNQALEGAFNYIFYFAGNEQGRFLSRRFANNADETTFSIRLNLQEIDPALYQEYLRAKSALQNIDRRAQLEENWKKWKEEASEIEAQLKYLSQELANLQKLDISEMDPLTLEKLGIAKNQFQLLTARQDELKHFIEGGEEALNREVEEAVARYQVVKSKAKKYNADLADLPIPPVYSESSQSTSISPVVSQMAEDLEDVLNGIEIAFINEDVINLRKLIRKWKSLSDLVVSSYSEVDQKEFNNTERNLLYHLLNEGTQKLFQKGLTKDLWTTTNILKPQVRKSIDALSATNKEAAKLRKTLYFKKVPENLRVETEEILDKVIQLNSRIDLLDVKSNKEKQANKIAEGALSVALSTLDEGIQNNNPESLKESKESLSIGMMVLDFALSATPVVSSARDAFELFTGKNIVTGESFDKLDYSMAFIGVVSGLVGGNIAKISLQRSKKVLNLISIKLNLGTLTAISHQIENFVDYYKGLRFGIISFKSASEVNDLIKKKYSRFTKDPFAISKIPFFSPRVFHRISENGEEYCRFFSKFHKDGKLGSNKIDMAGGIFVFRCADAMFKTVEEIKDLFAIPDRAVEGYYISKLAIPAGIPLYEGVVRSEFKKNGGGYQIFMDVMDQKILSNFISSREIKVTDYFKGF